MLASVFLIANNSVLAQTITELDELRFVADINASLLGNGSDIYFDDASVIVFNNNTNISSSINNLGNLDGAGIDAFHNTGDGCGDSIYSLDTAAMISGNAMLAADVFTASGIKVLDAKIAGVSDGVNIDAVSRLSDDCDLLISTDVTALLGGIAFKADDIIRYNSINGFSLYQATGFDANIDAIHYLSENRLLVSFDIGVMLPDVDGFDDDVFEIDLSNADMQLLAFSPAQFNDSWQGADINALWAKATENNGVIQWQVSSMEVTEGSAVIEIFLQRTDGSDGDIDIKVVTQSGTAIAGSDYQTIETTVSMADGETTTSVFLTLIDDDISEPVEKFTLFITSVFGGASLGPLDELTVFLNDQPAGIIQWSLSTATVNENVGTREFAIVRSGGTEGNIDINWSTTAGSAQAGIDFIEVNETITINHGETIIKVPLSVIDDNEIEDTETLKLRIDSVSAQASMGSTVVNLVSIIDNDEIIVNNGIIQWQFNTLEVSEGSAISEILLQRTNGSDGTVDIAVSSESGSAIAGTDYQTIDTTASMADGENTASVFLTLIDDSISESVEGFTISITSVSGGASIGPLEELEIILNDQPAGIIQWSQSTATVDEDDGTVQFVMVRSGGTEGDIDINWSTTGGSAQGGVDYMEVNETITINHGETTIQVPLSLIDDNEIEDTETLIIRIDSVSSQASIGSVIVNLISIVDNDDIIFSNGFE